MAKKILAALCALAVVAGTAAVLPQGAVKLGAAVTASAENGEPLTSGDYEYTVLDDGTVEISEYTGSGEEVTIPDEIDGKKVTMLGYHAFTGCKSLTSVTIPDSVTSVEAGCFSDTPMLNNQGHVKYADNWLVGFDDLYNGTTTEVVVKEGTKGIAVYAFGFNVHDGDRWTWMQENDIKINLKKVVLPKGIKHINACAFSGLSSLEEIDFPEGLESIGAEAFAGSGIKEAILPDSITSFSDYVFLGCEQLESVRLPENITDLGIGTFQDCRSLKTVRIPDRVTVIGSLAFYGCESLTSITIPDSVTSIGGWAFYGCSSLTSITIPDSVTDIGKDAFGYTYDEETRDNVPLDGFTISGYRNTAAEQYAKENGFEFIPLDKYIEGDCNGDGKVTMKDYSELQKYLSGWDVEIDLEAADLNGDGKVTMKDYAALQRKLNGWA